MRARTVQTAGLIVMVVAVLGTFACGPADAGRGPTGPTPPGPTPTAISQLATAYLDAILQIAQQNSVNTNAIDWARVRTEMFATAGAAQTIPDVFPAIGVLVRSLNDPDSFYRASSGARIGGQTAPCEVAMTGTPSLPGTVGYVNVPNCACQTNAASTQFAESIHRDIRAADRPGLDGWIVDLRGNVGGNMWPMIAGVGPVLGEGIIGYVVYPDREYEREYRNGGAYSLGEAFASVPAAYTLLKEYPKVAVLTGGATNSAGEALVAYFKGRPETRSFGTPTCGHHHLYWDFPLSDGAVLWVTASVHADRTRRQYVAAPLHPDEIITDRGQLFERAVAWLRDSR